MKLNRDQAWELRKLQSARRSLVRTRMSFLKDLSTSGAADTERLIEKLDGEIENLQDLSRDV